MSAVTTGKKDELKQGITRRWVQVGGMFAFQAALLFLSAGRLDWVGAWAFLGLYLAGIAINAYWMMRYSPETVAERGKAAGMKDWDKVVGGLWAIMYFIAVLVVAGLDLRFGWTGPLPPGLPLAGGAVFVLGFALFSWAMIANAYFSTVARIQADRGQTVCTRGPYRAVRHPGYVGAILQSVGAPLLLGSLWALVPGMIAAFLMVARTVLEDRMLQKELPGYQDYARQVRYRLLPWLW
jgi:protein-S-isoprenylcysteine O-methyltransferase Ste14